MTEKYDERTEVFIQTVMEEYTINRKEAIKLIEDQWVTTGEVVTKITNQASEEKAWNRIIGKARERFLAGGEEYGWDDWVHKDNLQDLEEELLDGIVYLMLAIRKLEFIRAKE